jgi:methyl-accepting chemotaxis protein
VRLGALGPRLAAVAADMESQAQSQARGASAVAETAGALVRELDEAMADLGASSGQVGKALTTVKRIADHTRLLSINASIEAARAGASGRAFAVVVDEVKQLADDTGTTTHQIDLQMEAMQASVARVAAVTGGGSKDAAHPLDCTVEAVNQQVRGIAASARHQLGEAQTLHSMGGQIQSLTEQLLLAVGKFRFEAHQRARDAVAEMVPALAGLMGTRERCEATLKQWLGEHSYFELVYVTDAQGRQFVDNIGWKEGRVAPDSSGFGRDWSDRPWYCEARHSTEVCTTDIYRSTATGDYCFTVASPVRDGRGETAGVVAADVNFQKLIQSDD